MKAAEPSFEVYGFAQLDAIQDFNRVNPAWNATLRPSRIPTTEGQYGSDGQTVLSVRQSLMDTNIMNAAPIRKMAVEIAALEQKPLIDVLGGLTLNDLRDMLADPADIIPQAQTREAGLA